MTSIFNKKKDKIISKALQLVANILINDYGKLVEFVVNSKDKTIFLKVLLKGEKEALKINFLNYSIVTECQNTYFQFDSIKTSREWINVFCNKKLPDILKKNKIQIPGYIAAPINSIL
ncbi:MAG: hypothetical protein JRF31_10600 [Deltaproteobacteria bacterium]|nr:hypothetical protein [Deltaproteobacteria bacterium]OQY09695.1 MAG: hypothetical protein B6I30_09430 [Desulfobacteraceae bacterium 4572_187]MBW1959332.1 hypothetical protein [Deltaproteobacteria bacterium]MBW2013651.1 hypothetical protein [Deltaproteobacteria bacterium]MBW2088983.1 hypothetical protein [Deltaproteobacteria bacterium]